MIKVIAKHFVKEEKVDKVLDLAKDLVEQTLKENGCINYAMYQDQENKKLLVMVEEWNTKEALDKHMVSEHFKRIVPQINELLEKKPEISILRKVI